MNSTRLLRFFKPKKEEFLVLDFGESSVKGLILEKNQEVGVIKKTDLQEIERFGIIDGKNFELEIIRRAAEKVIRNLDVSNRLKKIKTIVGLPPNILKARVVEVSFERQQGGRKIGKEEEKQIYNQVFQRGLKKLFEEMTIKDERVFADELEVVRERILESKISGYKIPAISGFRGRILDFKILFVFGSKSSLEFARELMTLLGLSEPEIVHEVEGLIKFRRAEAGAEIYLDIGFYVTQIFVFEDGLRFIEDFSVGGYNFSRALSKDLGITEQEAEILKTRLFENELGEGAKKKVETILSPLFVRWLENFQERLKKRLRNTCFSGNVLLFGGGVLPGIKEILEKERIGNSISLGLKTDFLPLDNLSFENKAKNVFLSRLIPLVLLSLNYAQKNH